MITDPNLTQPLGFAVVIGLGAVMLVIALFVRSMIRTTDDYIAAG